MKCKNCKHDIYFDRKWYHNLRVYRKDMSARFHENMCGCTNPEPEAIIKGSHISRIDRDKIREE